MTEQERWSWLQWMGREQPRGSLDALHRAKQALVREFGEHVPGDPVLCRCEACTDFNIEETARDYNALVLMLEGAPRMKTVADNLRRARDAARALSEALVGLDDFSRGQLELPETLVNYQNGPFHSPYLRLYAKARGMDLPTPQRENPASDGILVEQLKALETYIDQELNGFLAEHADEKKGANPNLLLREMGTPAFNLAEDCWFYFELHRPDEGTASENGPLLHFLNSVYEFATGETEENSTLHGWAKKIAGPSRRRSDLIWTVLVLQKRLEILEREPPTPKRDARINQLTVRLRVLQKGLDAATEALTYKRLAVRFRKRTL